MKFKIRKIQARDLVNVGTLLDVQDPGLKIRVGKYEFNTERKQDAGVNADFDDEFEMLIDDDDYELDHLKIEVEAFNISRVGSSTSLGKGSIALKSAVRRLNKNTMFSVELTYFSKKGNYRKGVVHMEGLLEKEGTKILLDDLKKGTVKAYPLAVRMEHFRASNLVDTGGVLDIQDPSLRIKFGSKEFMTSRQADAGTEAEFPDRFQFEISREDYSNGVEMDIEALNINVMGHQTHIGRSSISLKAAVPRLNRTVRVAMDLTHSSRKGGSYQQGVVEFEATISTHEKESIFVVLYSTLQELFSTCCMGDTSAVHDPSQHQQQQQQSDRAAVVSSAGLSNSRGASPSSSSTVAPTKTHASTTTTISEAFFSPMHTAMAHLVQMKDDEPEEPEPEPEPPRRPSFLTAFRQKKSGEDRVVSVKGGRSTPADTRAKYHSSSSSSPSFSAPPPSNVSVGEGGRRSLGQKVSGVFGSHSKKGFTRLEES